MQELHIIQVGDVLVSPDIITEKFCCDLDKCKGECCVEGDAGAPLTMDEIAGIEDALDIVWNDMSASAQAVVDKQGVAYNDRDGDLVTSIVMVKTVCLHAMRMVVACVLLNVLIVVAKQSL